jgi:hypothetical protein
VLAPNNDMSSSGLAGRRSADFVGGTAIARPEVMRIDLDVALRELEEVEPKVIVEPEIGAFCVVRPSGAPAPAAPVAERPSLEMILAYLAKLS